MIRLPSARRYAGLATMAIAVVLAGSAARGAEWEQPYPKLGSCTKKDTKIFSVDDTLYLECMENTGDEDYCSSVYPPIVFPYEDWKQIYHSKVDGILESFLGKAAEGHYAQREPPGGTNSCSRGLDTTTPAPPQLGEIAMKLEPWKDADPPPSFGQSDTTPVLLEYLRVYECSLAERSTRLALEIWRDESERRSGMPGGIGANPLTFAHLLEKWYEQSREIENELKIARPTLERTLGIMGTAQMARLLSQNAGCVQRVSLDIRNAVGL